MTRPARLLALLAALTPLPLAALELPAGAEPLADVVREDADLQIATGPFTAGIVPGDTLPGSLRQQSFRLPASNRTTTALIDRLSASLTASGQTPIFSCAARACGGFDFRFALDILPEPQMHVDLGDYRYASFRSQSGAATVLIASRSADAIFLQVSTLQSAASPVTTTAPTPAAPPPQAPPDAAAFATALESGGALVLPDVAFASGASALTSAEAPSLRLIAGYLTDNPTRTIGIVGHTDASGSLEANIALSRARAGAVRDAIVALGGDRGRITADGVGFLAPRATNLTDEGRQQNRRVEVMITSTR